MGKFYNPDVLADLGSYSIGVYHPFDVREIVSSFNDLLDVNTFEGTVYEGMRVLVMNEHNVYELISLNDSLGKDAIGLQFSTDRSQNKKLWKRLTIETIAESVATNEDMMKAQAALQRAKNNLVNGALIYIANDIKSGDTLIQKSGLYFCQNIDGAGKLTMAGGGGSAAETTFDDTASQLGAANVQEAIDELEERRKSTYVVEHGTIEPDGKGGIQLKVEDLSYHAGFVTDSRKENVYYLSMIGENHIQVYGTDFVYDFQRTGEEKKGDICQLSEAYPVKSDVFATKEELGGITSRLEEGLDAANAAKNYLEVGSGLTISNKKDAYIYKVPSDTTTDLDVTIDEEIEKGKLKEVILIIDNSENAYTHMIALSNRDGIEVIQNIEDMYVNPGLSSEFSFLIDTTGGTPIIRVAGLIKE